MPEQMATLAMFERHPEQVWGWYLMRFGACSAAEPNRAHYSLARLEGALDERFTLVTQNIDGLHRRAGSSTARTYCIHGDAAYVRCAAECGVGMLPLPRIERPMATELEASQLEQLRCPGCRGWLRPHVLWFDECYDEANYKAESALRAAHEAALLMVVGTSGSTSLPMRIGMLCQQSGATIVDINPELTPFGLLASRAKHGYALRSAACDAVPEIAEYFCT